MLLEWKHGSHPPLQSCIQPQPKLEQGRAAAHLYRLVLPKRHPSGQSVLTAGKSGNQRPQVGLHSPSILDQSAGLAP